MTNKETNELMMLESVDFLLEKRIEIIKELPSVVTTHQRLKSIILNIRELRQTQSKSIKEAKQEKGDLYMQVVSGVKKIRAGILAHSAANSINSYVAISDVTPSNLEKLRQSELIDYSRMVYETALAIAPALAPWGVTETDIEDLGKNYPAYNQSISNTRNQQGEVSTAGENIRQSINDGKKLLKEKLDAMLAPFETLNPTFFSEYQSARQILSLGKSHSSPTDTTTTPQT